MYEIDEVLVPVLAVVIVTGKVPALLAFIVHDAAVLEMYVEVVQAVPFTLMVTVPDPKFVPVRVTTFPPAAEPEVALKEVMVGGALYVNKLFLPLEPSKPVKSTRLLPVETPGGVTHEADTLEIHVDVVQGTESTMMVHGPELPNCVPVRTINVPPDRGPAVTSMLESLVALKTR